MMAERHLLVLDLDETLIFASPAELDRPADFTAAYHHVYRRPFLTEFLAGVGGLYEVAVWTSAAPAYAQAVCAAIFDAASPPAFIWDRRRCTIRRNADTDSIVETKPLTKLARRGYDLKRIVALDDSPEKYEQNYGNLVRVVPFEGAATDDELQHALAYLTELAALPNIRSVEKRGWQQRFRRCNDAAPSAAVL